jgi:hypothetical protein
MSTTKLAEALRGYANLAREDAAQTQYEDAAKHCITLAETLEEAATALEAKPAERSRPFGRCMITGPDEDVAFIFQHLPDVDDIEAKPAPVPDGWKLVPLEPTPEMLKRFDGFEFRAPFYPKHAALREGLWRSLLNAAPAAPAPEPLTDEQIEAVTSCLGFGQLSPITVARAIEQAHGIAARKETK